MFDVFGEHALVEDEFTLFLFVDFLLLFLLDSLFLGEGRLDEEV